MSEEVQSGLADKTKIPQFPHRPYVLMPFLKLAVPNLMSGEVMCMLQRQYSSSPTETQNTLIALRKQHGWSRATVAAFLGVSRDTLRRWESGQRCPCGAARRLIWLANTLLSRPDTLKDGLDMLLWGRRAEIEQWLKLFGSSPSGKRGEVKPRLAG